MSDALAISAVTAVLQYHLHDLFSGLTTLFGSHVVVSSKAPDIVQSIIATEASTQNQINLFMHQVTHNPAWRNVGLPSLAADGKTVLKNPPLALDLHYLLTAYGSHDWQAEALLGYAVLQLHQYPVLARADINYALQHVTSHHLPNLAAALQTSGLADQIEMIKITPATLGREEMAWLWTALKADYRPTFPFQVSVVLMTQPSNISIPFPVMRRHVKALPITPAQILSIGLPTGQAAALPGNQITVNGEFLSGAGQVSFVNSRLGVEQTVTLTASQVTNTTLTFSVPNNATQFPAGIYTLTVQFLDSSGNVTQSTNSLPIGIAPAINLPSVTVTNTATQTTITLTCSPYVWPSQSVYLAMNGIAAPAQDFTSVTNSLTFVFTPALSTTPPKQIAILQVDGVASLVTWQDTTLPPSFTGPMVTI
jgi:hypothetical protein